jgi:lantibiotic modifying enzyme
VYVRWWTALLLLALPAGAQEQREQDVNPVRPAAARLLRDRKACLRFAVEVGAKVADAKTGKADVYSGDAGVALLLNGLYRATKERRWREASRAALDRAYAASAKLPAGLYSGRAGVGQACLDAYRATGDKVHLDRARACAENLTYRATDVISGAAGTGIFLLNLHATTKSHLAEVKGAADYLVGLADRENGRARWPVTPGGRVYVGFSHGAAGIGYFLRHAARVTGHEEYKTLAEEAARYVESMAEPEGQDGWHWWRTDPPQRDEMVRIQWCHGAPGNGLFFADLLRLDGTHRAALARCLATTRRRGRTVRRSGCQCHGVAGNAELFLFAYPVTKDARLLEEARRFGSALLEPTADGYRVAGRYDPGYMTGWAGIGHFFLRLADPARVGMPLMVEESR